jgi:hypothetical protein
MLDFIAEQRRGIIVNPSGRILVVEWADERRLDSAVVVPPRFRWAATDSIVDGERPFVGRRRPR